MLNRALERAVDVSVHHLADTRGLDADQVDAPDVRADRSSQRRQVLALGQPPRMTCTGSPADVSSARTAAATLVAFESLT